MGCVKPARKVYGFILFYFLFFLFLTRGSDSAGWDVSGLPERCFILFYLVSFLPLPDKRQWRVQDGMCQACQKGQTAGHAVKTLTLKGRPYQRLWKYGFRCACCYLPQTLKPDTAKPTP